MLVAACSIRNRLTALKKDRGEFIKSQDVMNLYQAIVKQGWCFVPRRRREAVAEMLPVTRLNDVWAQSAPQQPNRLDTTLSDVFQLSL